MSNLGTKVDVGKLAKGGALKEESKVDVKVEEVKVEGGDVKEEGKKKEKKPRPPKPDVIPEKKPKEPKPPAPEGEAKPAGN